MEFVLRTINNLYNIAGVAVRQIGDFGQRQNPIMKTSTAVAVALLATAYHIPLERVFQHTVKAFGGGALAVGGGLIAGACVKNLVGDGIGGVAGMVAGIASGIIADASINQEEMNRAIGGITLGVVTTFSNIFIAEALNLRVRTAALSSILLSSATAAMTAQLSLASFPDLFKKTMITTAGIYAGFLGALEEDHLLRALFLVPHFSL